jgi:hypothetical protein
MRCLIPAAASGAIIGRGGGVIKQIGEKANCRLDLDEYVEAFNTHERVLHVKGTAGQKIIVVSSQSSYRCCEPTPHNASYRV